MTKHTPAPWKVDEQTGIVYVELISGREPAICHTQSSQTETLPFDVSIANARLIAAAPELLAACEFALSVQLHAGLYDVSDKLNAEKLQAAIAKAKGES